MKKPHWTSRVPTKPGLYWYKLADTRFNPFIAYNVGAEFMFIGIDRANSPAELRKEGMEFWSEPLCAPDREDIK